MPFKNQKLDMVFYVERTFFSYRSINLDELSKNVKPISLYMKWTTSLKMAKD